MHPTCESYSLERCEASATPILPSGIPLALRLTFALGHPNQRLKIDKSQSQYMIQSDENDPGSQGKEPG
jgi:hypothetical protein